MTSRGRFRRKWATSRSRTAKLVGIFTSTQRLYFTNRVSLHSVFIIHNIQPSYTFAQNWGYFKNRAASFVFVFFRCKLNLGNAATQCSHQILKSFLKVPSNVLDLFVCATQKVLQRKLSHIQKKRVNFTKTFESGPEDGFRPRLRELTAAGWAGRPSRRSPSAPSWSCCGASNTRVIKVSDDTSRSNEKVGQTSSDCLRGTSEAFRSLHCYLSVCCVIARDGSEGAGPVGSANQHIASLRGRGGVSFSSSSTNHLYWFGQWQM